MISNPTPESVSSVVTEVFSRLLNTAPGPDDNFFELGGDSQRGALAVTRIGRRLGVVLTLKDIFDHATVAGLTKVVLHAPRVADPLAPSGNAQNDYPLSYMQQNRFLRVTRALRQGRQLFQALVPFAIAIDGNVTDDEISDAFDRVVACHDALRTGFVIEPGTDRVTPFLKAPDQIMPKLERSDMRMMESVKWQSEVEHQLFTLAQTTLPLDRPPLLHARLLRFSDDYAVLLAAIEHQVFDGRSVEVLRAEIAEAIRTPGKALTPPLQYPEWTRQQLRYLDGPDAQRALGYWREALSGTLPYPDLHLPAPATQVDHSYAQFVDLLGQEQLSTMRRVAGADSATPFLAFLAAIAVSWRQSSGQADAVIHSPCENRQIDGSERLVGWLAHSLILRIGIAKARTWRDALTLARQAAVSSFEYQGMPFPQVVRTLQPEMHGTATRQPRLYAAYEPLEETVELVPGGQLRTLAVSEPALFADVGVTFKANETPQGLRLSTVYDPRTVDAGYVRRLHGNLVDAMRNMCRDLLRPID